MHFCASLDEESLKKLLFINLFIIVLHEDLCSKSAHVRAKFSKKKRSWRKKIWEKRVRYFGK